MKNGFAKLTAFRTVLIISLLLIVLFIIGFGISCQSQTPASAPPPLSQGLPEEPTPGAPSATPSTIEVAIQGLAFNPAEITVPLGSTIIWHNKDSVTHTVTAQDKMFNSGSLSGDDTFSYTFEQKGTFEYYCMFHPHMKGKVVVE